MQPFAFTPSLYPGCLPPAMSDPAFPTEYAGNKARLAGFGCAVEECSTPNVTMHLRVVRMPVISNDRAMCW